MIKRARPGVSFLSLVVSSVSGGESFSGRLTSLSGLEALYWSLVCVKGEVLKHGWASTSHADEELCMLRPFSLSFQLPLRYSCRTP